jgi:cation:H+ antiporter
VISEETVTEPIIQFILSALAIVFAGTFLARASDAIAELTKLGRLLAGSILLAGATSLPELLVDLSAIRNGMPDLAVGDLFGSSLMNLLILALADLLHRNPRKMFSRAGAQHALSAAMSINVTALAAVAVFLGPQLHGIGVGEIGIGVLTIGGVYILGLRLVYYDQQNRPQTIDTSAAPSQRQALARAFSMYFACALVIFIAAPFMAESAGAIAEMTGLGKTFIGSTLVAFCTSLPELVSTIAAVRIHPGNLLGSISRSHVLTALGVILATSVAVMGQLYHEEKRKKIIEPDALAIIAVVIGALYVLYWVGGT